MNIKFQHMYPLNHIQVEPQEGVLKTFKESGNHCVYILEMVQKSIAVSILPTSPQPTFQHC